MSAKSLSSHLEAEDMPIDAALVRTLIPKEKKRRMEEGLCLYCGEEGHKVGNCLKKQNGVLLRLGARWFWKTTTSSHSRNRVAGQSNTTTTIRFLLICSTSPLFYNSFVFRPLEPKNYNFIRFGGIYLFFR